MKIHRSATAVVAAVLAITTACSSSGGNTTGGTSGPAAGTLPATDGIPSPNSAQTPDLLHGLRKLHVPHSDDRQKMISSARDVCERIQSGDEPKALVKYTRQEFGNDQEHVTAARARRVIAVVKRSFCR